MKNIPLMFSASIFIFAIGCNKTPEQATAKSPNDLGKKWSTPYMTVQLPHDWRGNQGQDGAGNKITAFGPEQPKTILGLAANDPIVVFRYDKPKSNKTLGELVRENEERWQKNESSPGRFIGSASAVRLGTGKCVAYRLEYRRGNCENFNSLTKERNACISRRMNAVCEDRSGAFYEITSDLGQYVEAGKPSKDVVELERKVEKILSSIEFTQG